jgi:hypothetical protein
MDFSKFNLIVKNVLAKDLVPPNTALLVAEKDQ